MFDIFLYIYIYIYYILYKYIIMENIWKLINYILYNMKDNNLYIYFFFY